MKRREFLRSALAGASALTLTGKAAAASNTKRKPNIIFILADDLGYRELGCYGQKYIRTPNIDRIAKEGIKFTQHYSGSPVCAPSRCVLMTGKHTGHAYIRNNGNPADRSAAYKKDPTAFPGQHPIPESEVTIAELLKAQGYATGAMGKWGLGYEGSTGDPQHQGFDHFFGYYCQIHAHNHYPNYIWRNREKITLEGNDRTLNGQQHTQDLFVDEALQFINKNKNNPFFLYLPFAVPHLSIQVPEDSLAEYKGKIPEEKYKHRGYLKHPYPRAGYAAMITHMDKGIGQIMDRVKALGLDEDTLIVFTSDNGPTFDRLGGSDSEFFESAGEFKGLKGSLYEGGIRVPFVARWPRKIKAGKTTDHISAFWDTLPTLCDVAGATPPDDIDGISYLPTLLGGKQPEHDYLYWEFPAKHYSGQQAMRKGDWKAIRRNMVKGNRTLELYNLKKDPGEKKDVAKKHPELIQEFKDQMKAARTDSKLFPLPK